ncbi:uncharacterized protein BX663DRAFT_434613, partial [Cokeromyces recurvatus]|uniref:uncharacterized protein n=1 Tax=Cokeromyces recurvatus TaxID=90255 RepID=UPI002220D31B
MKSIFAAIVALGVSVVSAQYNIVSITSPLKGAVYVAGKPATISWINPQVSVIPKIVLAKGLPSDLQYVATIAQDVDANAGSYVWNVPTDLPAADDYALELGNNPNVSYSGLFTIKHEEGVVSTETTTTTEATTLTTVTATPTTEATTEATTETTTAATTETTATTEATTETTTTT